MRCIWLAVLPVIGLLATVSAAETPPLGFGEPGAAVAETGDALPLWVVAPGTSAAVQTDLTKADLQKDLPETVDLLAAPADAPVLPAAARAGARPNPALNPVAPAPAPARRLARAAPAAAATPARVQQGKPFVMPWAVGVFQ